MTREEVTALMARASPPGVWVSRRALEMGIRKALVVRRHDPDNLDVRWDDWPDGMTEVVSRVHCHATREEAREAAERMRANRMRLLEAAMARLRAIEFPEDRPTRETTDETTTSNLIP